MRRFILFVSLFALAACSEAPLEDQSERAAAEIEKQIQGDAKSLEAAADEAVKILKSEIDEDLKADGVIESVQETSAVSGNRE